MLDTSHAAATTVARWRAAAENADAAAALACLSPPWPTGHGVGSQPFEEAQLLLLDDTAHINQITLFGRPLPALTALMITLGPDLARRQGRRGLATLLRASATPIHAMVTSGDRTVVPRTRPRTRPT